MAIFRLKGSNPLGLALNNSHTTHYNFLRQYGLTDAHVPLLEYDFESVMPAEGPFREVRNELLAGTELAAADLWSETSK